METKVYDIIYRHSTGIGSVSYKRVTATRAYVNHNGQLIIENNGTQIEAFAKDVWITFEEDKLNTDGN